MDVQFRSFRFHPIISKPIFSVFSLFYNQSSQITQSSIYYNSNHVECVRSAKLSFCCVIQTGNDLIRLVEHLEQL